LFLRHPLRTRNGRFSDFDADNSGELDVRELRKAVNAWAKAQVAALREHSRKHHAAVERKKQLAAERVRAGALTKRHTRARTRTHASEESRVNERDDQWKRSSDGAHIGTDLILRSVPIFTSQFRTIATCCIPLHAACACTPPHSSRCSETRTGAWQRL